MRPESSANPNNFIERIRVWYGLIIVIIAVFGLRLFYLQVIKHDYYSKVALAGQLKQYEIPASRGSIMVHNGSDTLPIVLNETLYTLFADPKFITNPSDVAQKVEAIIGGKSSDYEQAMRQDTRYAVLAKKLGKDQKTKLDSLNIKGLGTRDEPHRTYPQGALAAQLLGFVNDDGEGKYGVEQFMNRTLAGQPGELKAITDAQGVPLLANPGNVIKAPVNGESLVLTVDISMQKQLEDILRRGVRAAHAKSGGALIIDPYSGAIKAMANFPTYDPGQFYKVNNASVFNNGTVSDPLEIGSVMKPLTLAAALNENAVSLNSTYFDPGYFVIDGARVTNVEEVGGAATRSVTDIIRYSLNTGATWLLMQMGGGQINAKARNLWHDYLTNHYQLGKATGVEQGYESGGSIPDPNKGFGLNIQYANTAFGQGMLVTPLQLGAALSSVINGGTYYKPYLVDAINNGTGSAQMAKPQIVKSGVVKNSVGLQVRSVMEYSFSQNHALYGMPETYPKYNIGAKSGTPQITKPGGGYYLSKYNGMMIGFVGGDKPQYLVVVRVNEPNVPGYAGPKAAGPIFVNLIRMLINNIGVTPKTH